MLDSVNRYSKSLVLFALLLLELLAAVDTSGVTVLVPHLQHYFFLRPSNAGLVLTAYLVPFCAGLIPLGIWADRRIGPERLIRISILGFALFSGVCALSTHFAVFAGARFFKGICAAGIFTCEFVIIMKYWENPRRAIELVLIGLAAGLMIGPFVGAWFVNASSWRVFFGIGTAIALSAFLFIQPLSKLLVKDAYQKSMTLKSPPLSKVLKGILTGGGAGLILNFVLSFSMQGASLVFTLHLQESLGASAMVNGWVLAVVAAGMAVQNGLGIGSRLFPDAWVAALAGSLVFAAGLVGIWFETSWQDIGAFGLYFVLGAALGVALSSVDLMILGNVPPSVMALATALVTTIMQGGMATASGLIPILYAATQSATLVYISGILIATTCSIFIWHLKRQRFA